MAKKSKQYDYDLGEVKRLIEETEKNYREISKETGCPYASVVYHGRKIRGRVNRSKHDVIAEVQAGTEKAIQEESDTLPLFGGTTLNISRNNISIHDAEQEAARMIKAAKALGLSKINITIEK
ncbi:hypothetical protein [Halobacillus sp. A5]|uniref:hypothetical protein n=1 Tax=Halobacillus sp. A5 TaxID=2880263 RepID=UPI0020A6A954|nr:hypothetical protein [Halobacillus sp. A5]MCP3028058.1 hypothetical protein [Halobacillus sp. A5]